MPCRHGEFAFFAHDRYVGRSLELYGEWSEGEVDLFRQIVKPGAHVVEAGANIGSHTVPLAKLGARVLAIEGQPAVKAMLDDNLALNQCHEVRTRLAMVSCAPGEIHLPRPDYEGDVNVGGVSAHAATRARSGMGQPVGIDKVPAIAIDDLNLARVDLLKADVEGFELPLLLGAERTIKRTRPLLYLEANSGPSRPALIAFVRALDYRVFGHVVPMYRPENFRANPVNVFENIASHNIFCVPAERAQVIKGLPELT